MRLADAGAFLRNLSGVLIWPVLVALGLFGLGWGWVSLAPVTVRGDVEVEATIGIQMERAVSALPSEVLVVGDSACLFGIDAAYLGELLGGRRVENLCTIAFPGARGYAALVDQYFAAGNQTQYIVIAMHPVTLNIDHIEAWDQWENMVIAGRLPPKSTVTWGHILPLLRTRLPVKMGNPPLPGNFGQYYGTLTGYLDYISSHQGSAFSPWPALSASLSLGSGEAWPTALQADKYRALQDLVGRTQAWPVKKIFLYLPPIAATHATVHTSGEYATVRHMITQIIHEQAASNVTVLDTPAYGPSELFYDLAHATRSGRWVIMRDLAVALTDEGAGIAQPPLTASVARWGGLIDLVGYTLEPPGTASTNVVGVRLAWRRVVPIPAAYTTFVHLQDSAGQLIAQQDHPPRNGIRPTTDWWDAEVVNDRFSLTIPPDVEPGEYIVRVGWYASAGERLLVRAIPDSGEEDGLVLGSIRLGAPKP